MSSIEALHYAAPSLKRRRTHSHKAVVETRQRLAVRTTSQELAAVADPTSDIPAAEPFYDESLTVEPEDSDRKWPRFAIALLVGLSCGAAIAALLRT